MRDQLKEVARAGDFDFIAHPHFFMHMTRATAAVGLQRDGNFIAAR